MGLGCRTEAENSNWGCLLGAVEPNNGSILRERSTRYMRVYEIKIYENDELARDYLPAVDINATLVFRDSMTGTECYSMDGAPHSIYT